MITESRKLSTQVMHFKNPTEIGQHIQQSQSFSLSKIVRNERLMSYRKKMDRNLRQNLLVEGKK